MKKVTFLSITLAFIASSITLWLLESPLKYICYFFEAVLILALYRYLFGNSRKIRFVLKRDATTQLDYILLAISLILLTLTTFRSNSILNLICAIIISFFLPGYVILRSLRFHYLYTWIEWPVLALVLSIPMSSIIYTFVLFLVPIAWRAITLSSVFVIISLGFAIKSRKTEEIEPQEINVSFDLYETFILLIIVVFFIFAITAVYPQMSLLPGLDIVRHYSNSLKVNIIPDRFFTEYPWFNFQWAIINILSNQPIEIFQTSLAYLSLISILSFYVMADTYLRSIDKRLSALATTIWAIFSGFGWVYLLREKLATLDTSKQYDLLIEASDKTYWDISYGQGPWLWLWFRPITIGFAIIFVLLYLLKREDIPRRNLLFLFSLIVTTLGMVHIPDLALFIASLFFMALLKPTAKLHLADASLSTSLGVLAMAPLVVLYWQILGFTAHKMSFYPIIGLFAISIMSYILVRKPQRPSLRCSKRGIYFFVVGILSAYVALFAVWFSSVDAFSVKYAMDTLGVPWLLYPVLLGMGGLLAFAGLALALKAYREHPVTLFACLFLTSILVGRTLTFLNATFLSVPISYWERRVIPLVYSASCILASLALVKAGSDLSNKRFKKVLAGILITFVVISGFTSTLASIEFWSYSISRGSLTRDEIGVITYLSKAYPKTLLLTVSERSRLTAEYAPLGWIVNYYRYHLWPSKYPEIPLYLLSSMNSSAIIYLHERDLNKIAKNYSGGYMASHLLKLSPETYSTTNVKIYNIPKISRPSPNSNLVLVIPEENHDQVSFAYDLLSLGNYNYTVALASDLNIIRKADVLIFPTEDLALRMINLGLMKEKKIIVLNVDGYEQIASKLFSTSMMTFSMNPNYNNNAFMQIGKTGVITGGDTATKIADLTRFAVMNTLYDHDSLMIADDNSASLWRDSCIGSGNIGITRLIDEHELKASGDNSLAIEVGQGKYACWQISTVFPSSLNLTLFDFISFYWYGRGDGKYYVLQYHSETPKGSFWYRFKDTWVGWKKVLIPMWAPDGDHNLYSVEFNKVTNGDATWSAIKEVQIRLEASNPNVPGTFYIDKFGFEAGRWVAINIDVGGPPRSLTLCVNNSTGYTELFTLTKATEINTSSSWLIGNTPSRSIFGDRPTLKAILSINNSKQFFLSFHVKLPPSIEGIEPLQARFMIYPQIKSVNEIESVTSSISLPVVTPVQPLLPTFSSDFYRYRVLASYKGEIDVPFALSLEDAKGFELTYLNVHPLIQKLILYNDESRKLYPLLGELLQLSQVELPKYNYEKRDPVKGGVAVFTEAVLNGDITISSPSIVIPNNHQNLTISIDGTSTALTNVQTISFLNVDSMEIKTTHAKIKGGIGFYTNITVDEPAIVIKGEKPKALILLSDSTTQMLSNIENLNITTNSTQLQIIARQPEIKIHGDGDFKTFYGYWEVARMLRTLGQDLKINGKMSFLVDYGDVFTITREFNWQGPFERSPPLLIWDEWKDAMNMLPWLALISAICTSWYLYKKKKAH